LVGDNKKIKSLYILVMLSQLTYIGEKKLKMPSLRLLKRILCTLSNKMKILITHYAAVASLHVHF